MIILPLSLLAEPVCIEGISNPSDDPYLEYAVLRAVERALIESGYEVSCGEGSSSSSLTIVSFQEVPIAYTPEQRINLYNLTLRLKVLIGEKVFTVGATVPYSLPSGSSGDIPRRRAIDDLTDKIYSYILQNLRR